MSVTPILADISLMLPLVYEGHEHHKTADAWFEGAVRDQVIICRYVQQGLLRLLNNPASMAQDVFTTKECWRLWRKLLSDERIRFTPSEPAGLDPLFERYTIGRNYTPKLWMDAYLAAYAKAAGFCLATFDKGFRQFPDLNYQILRVGQAQ